MERATLELEVIDILYDILTSNLSDEEKAKQIVDKTNYQKVSRYFYWNGKAFFPDGSKLENIRREFNNLKSKGEFKKYELTYRCSFEEVDRRLKILNELNEMLKQDLTDEQKIKKILKIFPNYEEFRRKYSLMIKYGKDDERLNLGRESLNEFDKINQEIQDLFNNEQLLNNIKYEETITKYLENCNDLVNYQYAEWVVKKYLEYDRSYLTHEFVGKLEINKDRLDKCTNIVKFLNPTLYSEYQEKVKQNTERRIRAVYITFRDIADAINKGFFNDGTPFDMVEFYKRLPMKNEGASYIMYFLYDCIHDLYTYSTIHEYMRKNRIRYFRYVSENKMLNDKCVRTISGVLITPEIIHQVFEHMRVNNIPPIDRVYEIILGKYVRNEITLDKAEDILEDEKTKVYTNPYKFIPKKKDIV